MSFKKLTAKVRDITVFHLSNRVRTSKRGWMRSVFIPLAISIKKLISQGRVMPVLWLSNQVFAKTHSLGWNCCFSCLTMSFKKLRQKVREIRVFYLSHQAFYETQRPGEGTSLFFNCVTMSFKALRAQVRDMTVFHFSITCFIKLTAWVREITVFHLSDHVF